MESITHFFTDVNIPLVQKDLHIFKKTAHLIGKKYKAFPSFVCSPATWKLLDPYELKILSGISLLTLDHKKFFITYSLSTIAGYCQISRDKAWRAINRLLKLRYLETANYNGRKVIMLNMLWLLPHLSEYGEVAYKEVKFD